MPTLKILIIRFSSIGDIVLTTPVLELLHHSIPSVEIHYLTKHIFGELVRHHPLVNKLYTLDADNYGEIIGKMKAENYDYILDLHHSLRSWRIKAALRKPFATFDKKNIARFLYTKAKIRSLTVSHVVERYEAVAKKIILRTNHTVADISPPLRFYYPPSLEENITALEKTLSFLFSDSYTIVLGATHATKKWLPDYFIETIHRLGKPIVLLGGKQEQEMASYISQKITVPHYNSVSKHPLLESACLMRRTRFVLTHDTGFMHIAAAFRMRIFSLWGSTSPQLGFAPYQTENISLEIKDLDCHPCSKIGLSECPKGHFLCMKRLTAGMVSKIIEENQP